MKPTERLFPNFVSAVVSLEKARLQEIAKAADVAIDDLKPDDLAAVARRLLERLKEPGFFLHHVKHDDEVKMATALGIADEAAWSAANPVTDAVRAMADYARPSWKKTVWNAFQEKAEPPRPVPRKSVQRDPQFAEKWPELASVAAFEKLTPAARTKLAVDLAKALGKEFAAGSDKNIVNVTHVPTGIDYVAVPSGKFSMGLSKDELSFLRKATKGDPEATELLKGYAMQVRPEHDVQIPAFLCAKTPLLASHVKKLVTADCANVHHVARMTGENAAALVPQIKARLLTEAEWEWVARADGAREWTVSGDSPRDAIAKASADSDLSEDAHPWGVSGLAWGTWVDDGWQNTYKKAPDDGSAWTPMEIPEVVRGGGLASWPWQSAGEVLMTHVTFRDRDRLNDQAVLVALDLPARAAE